MDVLARPSMRRAVVVTGIGLLVAVVGASVTSLLGAGFVLNLAGQDSGPPRVLFIGVAVVTVVLSWSVVNTVYTLRYAG